MGRSRKMKEEAEKINEEERALQIDFMDYHNSTKQYLADMKEKYGLNYHNKHKYLRKKSKNEYYLKRSNPTDSPPPPT